MKRKQTILSVAALLAAQLLATTLSGCGAAPTTEPAATAADATGKNPIQRMFAEPGKKAGSELWAENCTRCHNARPPQYYSDPQWDVIVHHMRLRANLTGEEARAIAEFLRASN